MSWCADFEFRVAQGLPFHFHKEAWNEAVAGLKRWTVYPPERVPPGHYLMIDSHQQWLERVLVRPNALYWNNHFQ